MNVARKDTCDLSAQNWGTDTVAVREDDLEEIAENTKGNLKEDAESNTSREEEIPQEEEDNLNKSSGEDEEMYSWDKLEYKANYVHFISNESTER